MGDRRYATLADELGAAALDARAAVREVHEVLRDARDVIKQLQATAAAATAAGHAAVGEDVDVIVKAHVDALGAETDRAMAAAVAKVNREFDRLGRLFLGEGVEGIVIDLHQRREGRRPSAQVTSGPADKTV